MWGENNLDNGCRRQWGNLWMVIGFLLLVAWNMSVASAQQTSSPTPDSDVIHTSDLYNPQRVPGKLLAEGNNMVPVGELKVKSYRLEEVKLPKPLELSIQGRRARVENVLRLTITLESFLNGIYTIWLGEEPLTGVPIKEDELSVLIYDRALLEDGITIAVSNDTLGGQSRTILPERLYLPPQVRSTIPPRNDDGSLTRIRRINIGSGRSFVEMELTSDQEFQIRNAFRMIQIGEREFFGGSTVRGNPRKLIIQLTPEEFAQLKDGDRIFVKYGYGESALRGAQKFGRLNKSLLEQ